MAKVSASTDWDAVAHAYGNVVNRATEPAAKRLIVMAAALRPIEADSHVLDVGAGAGAATLSVVEHNPKTPITAIDTAAQMLDQIRVPSTTPLEKRVCDAADLTQIFPPAAFTHALVTFALHVVPDADHVLREMRGVLTTRGDGAGDGVLAAAIWGPRMDNLAIFARAATALDPTYRPPRFERWRSAADLRAALTRAGCRDVVTEEMTLPLTFASAEDWAAFVFEAKHPVEERLLATWTGDRDELRAMIVKVVREEYQNGQGIMLSAVLAAGLV